MTPAADPYRVLGLPPGAPLDDVKRAYRRLAKEAHPDAAGAAATARFIALQRAYESIVRGPASGRRPVAPRQRGRSGPATGGAGAAGGGGAGTTGGGAGAAGGGAGAGSTGPTGATGATGAPGGARKARGGTSGRKSGGGSARPRGHRPARPTEPVRARLGTTTYDGVDGDDESWHGASWYGVSTGTYWTINPKEYADPRKHGPEYLARGRRPVVRRPAAAAAPTAASPEPAGRDTGRPGTAARPAGLRAILRRIGIGG